jgi:hypothetical protein
LTLQAPWTDMATALRIQEEERVFPGTHLRVELRDRRRLFWDLRRSTAGEPHSGWHHRMEPVFNTFEAFDKIHLCWIGGVSCKIACPRLDPHFQMKFLFVSPQWYKASSGGESSTGHLAL